MDFSINGRVERRREEGGFHNPCKKVHSSQMRLPRPFGARSDTNSMLCFTRHLGTMSQSKKRAGMKPAPCIKNGRNVFMKELGDACVAPTGEEGGIVFYLTWQSHG
jgi:hypothetical protein